VDILLLSEKLRKNRLSIRCDACGFAEEKTVQVNPGENPEDIDLGNCPNCTSPLVLADSSDIVDELTYLADQSNSKVAIISDDFEEGSQLFTAFGGIAAILRYRTGY
jgi:peptide chain release factor subunit 1